LRLAEGDAAHEGRGAFPPLMQNKT
jgi:hypothetical protein